jgi:hypothetical protein
MMIVFNNNMAVGAGGIRGGDNMSSSGSMSRGVASPRMVCVSKRHVINLPVCRNGASSPARDIFFVLAVIMMKMATIAPYVATRQWQNYRHCRCKPYSKVRT